MDNYVDDEYETWSLNDCSINELDELIKRQDVPQALKQQAIKLKKEMQEQESKESHKKTKKKSLVR